MKSHLIIILSVVVFSFGCSSAKREKYSEELYWPFHHVREKIDPNDEKVAEYFDYDTLTSREKDTLIKILTENHKDFKLGTDGEILVTKIDVPDIENMSFIDSELRKRMKYNDSIWSWDSTKIKNEPY